MSDDNCAYEYFTGTTYGESYFKVTGHAPATATAKETFTTAGADACAGWLLEYAGDSTNTRLSYTYKSDGTCTLYSENEGYTSSGTATTAPDTITLTAEVGTDFYGMKTKQTYPVTGAKSC